MNKYYYIEFTATGIPGAIVFRHKAVQEREVAIANDLALLERQCGYWLQDVTWKEIEPCERMRRRIERYQQIKKEGEQNDGEGTQIHIEAGG